MSTLEELCSDIIVECIDKLRLTGIKKSIGCYYILEAAIALLVEEKLSLNDTQKLVESIYESTSKIIEELK